ncbi:MAG: hypothetical protein Kow0077_27350 [Anaerolineae bacterium]
MSIQYVQGDILLTTARVLCVDFNARGQPEATALHTRLAYDYPAAFAAFRKHTRNNGVKPGTWWLWREATPWLGLLIVRETSSGASRLRYVEAAAQQLLMAASLEGVTRIALQMPGTPPEWPSLREPLDFWLKPARLQVVVYEGHLPGRRAPENWNHGPL